MQTQSIDMSKAQTELPAQAKQLPQIPTHQPTIYTPHQNEDHDLEHMQSLHAGDHNNIAIVIEEPHHNEPLNIIPAKSNQPLQSPYGFHCIKIMSSCTLVTLLFTVAVYLAICIGIVSCILRNYTTNIMLYVGIGVIVGSLFFSIFIAIVAFRNYEYEKAEKEDRKDSTLEMSALIVFIIAVVPIITVLFVPAIIVLMIWACVFLRNDCWGNFAVDFDKQEEARLKNNNRNRIEF